MNALRWITLACVAVCAIAASVPLLHSQQPGAKTPEQSAPESKQPSPELGERVANLEKRLLQGESELWTHRGRVADLEKRLTAANSELKTLTSRINRLESNENAEGRQTIQLANWLIRTGRGGPVRVVLKRGNGPLEAVVLRNSFVFDDVAYIDGYTAKTRRPVRFRADAIDAVFPE